MSGQVRLRRSRDTPAAAPRGWYIKAQLVPERFCWRCKAGDHSLGHDAVMGCTALTGREPNDRICACMEAA